MSDLVRLMDVKVVDGYAVRMSVARELNELHTKMMQADDPWQIRLYYGQFLKDLNVYCKVDLVSKKTRKEIERRLENDFDRKICAY